MILFLIKKLFDSFSTNYGSSMQSYIESKRPQSGSDVERLEKEYQRTLWRNPWMQ